MGLASHRIPPGWRPSSPEALRLAATVRSARLTLLCGTPESETTPLLTDGLLPLLHRRAAELQAEHAEAHGYPRRDSIIR